jgi:hypothetical protein
MVDFPVVNRIEMLCDFLQNGDVQRRIAEAIPATMLRHIGSVGFDTPLWAGLGVVGLWSAMDAYRDRAGLTSPTA